MSSDTEGLLLVTGAVILAGIIGYFLIKLIFFGGVSAARAAGDVAITETGMQVGAMQAARLVCYLSVGGIIYLHVDFFEFLQELRKSDEKLWIATYVGSLCQIVLFHGIAVALGLISRNLVSGGLEFTGTSGEEPTKIVLPIGTDHYGES
jgi:hypothetical protein